MTRVLMVNFELCAHRPHALSFEVDQRGVVAQHAVSPRRQQRLGVDQQDRALADARRKRQVRKPLSVAFLAAAQAPQEASGSLRAGVRD